MTKTTDDIYKKIWELSPNAKDPQSYAELTQLTAELIDIAKAQGRLSKDPIGSAWERKISLPSKLILKKLKGRTCLVTGGLGCIGTVLMNELMKFQMKHIVILDIAKDDRYLNQDNVTVLHCDIRDESSVLDVFKLYKPEYVFHLAAQRDPGISEEHVVETVNTNVFGTINIVKSCEATPSVKQMMSTSTGKASRYFTEEVYAATKKLLEFIVDTYAKKSRIKYSMTRCTHILDNSLMNHELENSSRFNSYVAVHSPHKYVTAQNANESAYLILNCLIYSLPKQSTFLLSRHLEWPVESLEMALYHINKSERAIPVVFVGNPKGYSEKFYRGQLDWSNPNELNLLINVYERKHSRLNREGDIIISIPCSTDEKVLEYSLDKLKYLHTEQSMKTSLHAALKDIVKSSLTMVNPNDTLNILRWGFEDNSFETDHTQDADFSTIINMLIDSLQKDEYKKEIQHLINYEYAFN